MRIPSLLMRACIVSALLFCFTTLAHAQAYSSVVVYGDSLSDNGNLFAVAGQPGAPYFQGRRSDGPVAVEYLATALGAPLLDFAWVGATSGIGNYADGGTPTTAGLFSLPGMQAELATTQSLLSLYLSSGLFVVWGGANDFLAPSPLDATPLAIANRALSNDLGVVQSLRSLGAQHILVPGLPDLGLTPYFQSLGPLAAAQASALTDVFNAGLRSGLPSGAFFYDVAALERAAIANPAAFGFTNVTDACFNGATVCANPSQYLFFDEFHPTTAAHRLIAEGFLTAAVPEPETYVLMLAGLGLIGFVKRRRQRNF